MKPFRFIRGFSVRADTMKVLESTFPWVDFELTGNERHPHPVAAAERAIMEERVYQQILKRFGCGVSIVDIGGSSRRHLMMRRKNVHCCCPLLDGADHFRAFDDSICCRHSVMDCACVPVDVYLSVHSLYYLSVEEVCVLVHRSRRGRLFAVVHMFENLYGCYHHDGEDFESAYETYVKDDKLRISMTVNGNIVKYDHPSVAWLHDTYYDGSAGAIAWTGSKCGDVWVLEFTTAVRGLRSSSGHELSLVESINRMDHYGMIGGMITCDDKEGLKPRLQAVNVHVDSLSSVGPFLWLKGGNKTVLLPKDVVLTVAVKMVGVNRVEKDSLKRCINMMRAVVSSSKLSLPEHIRHDCVVHGSALAFVYGLEKEISSFSALSTVRKQTLYSAHLKVMAFRRLWNFAWLYRLIRFLWNVSRTPLLLCCAPKGSGHSAPAEEYRITRKSIVGSPYEASKEFPDGYPGTESTRVLADKRKGSSVSGIDREQCVDRPQFHSIAPAFQECVPLVPYSSVNNESVSVVNRALMKVPEPSPLAWALVRPYVKQLSKAIVDKLELCDEDEAFVAWNAKFPPHRRLLQEQAYERVKNHGLEEVHFRRKAFVKRELTLPKEEPQDFDPRCIQAVSDEANVALGPFMQQFSKALVKVWDIEADVYYTSGSNAEQLGLWRAQFGSEDVLILIMDQNRFDAHQQKEVHKVEDEMYVDAGIKKYSHAYETFKAQKVTRGVTSHGVKYKVKNTRKSGDPNTSNGNSSISGLTIKTLMARFGFEGRFKAVVNGDDNLIVIRELLSNKDVCRLVRCLRDAYFDLGFDMDIKTTRTWAHAEFCSSLFWPVSGGYVLGPKIGRRLPKLGFSLQKLKPTQVKGMLVGLQREAGFVPILGRYATWCLSKMRKIKAKVVGNANLYKSLPTEIHTLNYETIQFFEERYELSFADTSISFEGYLSTLNSLNTVASWPEIQTFIRVDT